MSPLRRLRLLGARLAKRGLARGMWLVWRLGLNPLTFFDPNPETPGRFYIERWLRVHTAGQRGVMLEFGIPFYRQLFSAAQIERYDVLDIAPAPAVTIVGDIQACPQIASDTYDLVICTQVLEHVPNPFLAAAELHRIIKPGGRLLLTVPAAYPYHPDPQDYWRFSRDSLALLFGSFRQVAIESHGNRLSVMAGYWFWTRRDLPTAALLASDDSSPSILSVSATK